jgi:hypothetical protein
MKDYYAILEVSPTASPEILTEAYRAKVLHSHPDRFHTRQQKDLMHEQMILINEAYGILYDPQNRAHYDQKRGLNAEKPNTKAVRFNPSPLRGLVFLTTLAILASLGLIFHGLISIRLLLLIAASALIIYRYPMPTKPTLSCALVAVMGLVMLNALWGVLPIPAKLFLFLGLFYGIRLIARRSGQKTLLP